MVKSLVAIKRQSQSQLRNSRLKHNRSGMELTEVSTKRSSWEVQNKRDSRRQRGGYVVLGSASVSGLVDEREEFDHTLRCDGGVIRLQGVWKDARQSAACSSKRGELPVSVVFKSRRATERKSWVGGSVLREARVKSASDDMLLDLAKFYEFAD